MEAPPQAEAGDASDAEGDEEEEEVSCDSNTSSGTQHGGEPATDEVNTTHAGLPADSAKPREPEQQQQRTSSPPPSPPDAPHMQDLIYAMIYALQTVRAY